MKKKKKQAVKSKFKNQVKIYQNSIIIYIQKCIEEIPN